MEGMRSPCPFAVSIRQECANERRALSRSSENANSLPLSPWPLDTLPSLPPAMDFEGVFSTDCLLGTLSGGAGRQTAETVDV